MPVPYRLGSQSCSSATLYVSGMLAICSVVTSRHRKPCLLARRGQERKSEFWSSVASQVPTTVAQKTPSKGCTRPSHSQHRPPLKDSTPRKRPSPTFPRHCSATSPVLPTLLCRSPPHGMTDPSHHGPIETAGVVRPQQQILEHVGGQSDRPPLRRHAHSPHPNGDERHEGSAAADVAGRDLDSLCQCTASGTVRRSSSPTPPSH